jgi:hypothetical protein
VVSEVRLKPAINRGVENVKRVIPAKSYYVGLFAEGCSGGLLSNA